MEKKRILISDDDESLLAALSTRFGREGYDVITAFDGHNALAQAARKHPDMIIMDVNLPGSNGFAVQERLQKLGWLSTPVIYMTGERSDRVEILSRQFDALAVFYKPLDTNKLLLTVRNALAES